MSGKTSIRKEKSMTYHISRAISYCHTLIDTEDECLDDIISLIIDHYEIYSKKHFLSYSRCCNSFNTEYQEKKSGKHLERNEFSVPRLLNMKSLNRKELSDFIGKSGWSNDKGQIVYPGWNMVCLDYKLEERNGIMKARKPPVDPERVERSWCEGDPLNKRGFHEKQDFETNNMNKTGQREMTMTPVKNKFFHREQYYNDEYIKLRCSGKKETKEEPNTIVKEKCR